MLSLPPANKASGASLMGRTVAVVLAVNLFLMGLGVVTLRQSRDQYLRSAETQGHNLARTLVFSISGVFDAADVALLSVVDEVERQLRQGSIAPGALNAFIIAQHTRLPALDSIRMADGRGDILYGTGVAPGSKKSIAERDYFKKLRETRQAGLVISRPVLGLISGKWVLILASGSAGLTAPSPGWCTAPFPSKR